MGSLVALQAVFRPLEDEVAREDLLSAGRGRIKDFGRCDLTREGHHHVRGLVLTTDAMASALCGNAKKKNVRKAQWYVQGR